MVAVGVFLSPVTFMSYVITTVAIRCAPQLLYLAEKCFIVQVPFRDQTAMIQSRLIVTFHKYRHLAFRRPYNLYCVGGDVKPCSINLGISNVQQIVVHRTILTVCWT